MEQTAGNRLGGSLSPYLVDHARNPVHWQPWDSAALRMARDRNVPVLLSIGYSACHWCHVMEHESFADEGIAAQMNEGFVCIKVDREERPDLDKTYQAAHYLLSRSPGGWPLTLFLDANLVPFFSGTYFPPQRRGSLPAFTEILARVQAVWQQKHDAIAEQGEVMGNALRALDDSQAGEALPGAEVVDAAAGSLAGSYEMATGGLGKAPKFPQNPSLQLSLQLLTSGDEIQRDGLVRTLDVMAAGGLHDHVGGGFFRYCVDPLWDIPHFEKMLYDNAQMLELYASAAVALDRPDYRWVAERTAQWLCSAMLQPGGGFATALDADSEGQEGRYYLWRKQDLEAVVEPDALVDLADYANTAGLPNFEDGYHLHQPQDAPFGVPGEAQQRVFNQLLAAREQRVAPALDDKVLAASCGLAAHAFARAGRLLEQPLWLQIARDALEFVDASMVVDGQYRCAWRAGSCSPVGAFVDDLAYLLAARLRLFEAQGLPADLDKAVALADLLIANHHDGEGGLLFCAADSEQPVRRIRSCDDGPTPSGNGVAARSLLQLGWMLARPGYLEVAAGILRGFARPLEQTPAVSPTLVSAAMLWHRPPPVIYLTGDSQAVADWHARIRLWADSICLPLGDGQGHAEAIAKPQPDAGAKVWAHYCLGSACHGPFADLGRLREDIDSQTALTR